MDMMRRAAAGQWVWSGEVRMVDAVCRDETIAKGERECPRVGSWGGHVGQRGVELRGRSCPQMEHC